MNHLHDKKGTSPKIWESDPRSVRLLIRTIPFILARPDIGAAPLPACWDLPRMFRAKTLGGLARLWTNAPGPACPVCRRESALVDFGGSLLSGAGKFASWFCPWCGKTFDTKPESTVTEFGSAALKASRAETFVITFEGSEKMTLPPGILPEDLGNVFHGRLSDAYFRLALEELGELDRAARASASAGEAFQVRFRLKVGQRTGDVVFGNINGTAEIRVPGLGGGLPVRYDECFGLMPMLREAAARIARL